MKLLKCNLRSFGQFEHEHIEFDSSKSIHVLYGENESGKSTFTRAFLSLLFGIEKNTTDDYLYLKENLFIEGLFQSYEGKLIQVNREYTLSRTLNATLHAFFPDINKLQYSENFILDDLSLRAGAKDLLAHLKQFDVSLFQSATGLSQVQKILRKLEIESDSLFKPRGIKPTINALFSRYSKIKEQEKEALLTPQAYSQKKEEQSHLEGEIEKLKLRKKQLEAFLNDFELLLIFQKGVQSLITLNSKLALLEKDLIRLAPTFPLNKAIWVSLKKCLLDLLRKKTLLDAQAEDLEKALVSAEEKWSKSLTKQPPGVDKKKALFFKQKLEFAQRHLPLEENVYFYKKQIQKEELKLKSRIQKLNLNISCYKNFLSLKLPSPFEFSSIQDLSSQLELFERTQKGKKERLKQKYQELSNKLNQISSQTDFNLVDYHKNRKQRLQLFKALKSKWNEYTKPEIEAQLNILENVIEKESAFTDQVILKTELFVEYKTVSNEIKATAQDLQNYQEQEQKIYKVQQALDQALEHYRENWNLKSCSLCRLQEIYYEMPSLQSDVKSYLELKDEQKKITHQYENILIELRKDFEGKSIKEMVHQLDQKVKNLFSLEKEAASALVEKKQMRSQVETIQAKLKDNNHQQEVLIHDWNSLLKKYNFELELSKDPIETRVLQTDHYFEKSTEKKHIENFGLLDKKKELQTVLKQILDSKCLLNTFEGQTAIQSLKKLMEVDDNLKNIHQLDIGFKVFEKQKKNYLDELSEVNTSLSSLERKLGGVEYELNQIFNIHSQANYDIELQDVNFSLNSSIEEYVTSEVSAFVLKKLVRNYQKNFQGAFFDSFSHYFSKITLGRYKRVLLNLLVQNSFLTCESDLGVVSLQQLSKGTQEQLYLALKFALIDQYLTYQEPLPILLDDILVQCDDKRAKSTLEVIQDLSKRTQIIFLTHNQHLVDLIEKTLPQNSWELHYLSSKSSVLS